MRLVIGVASALALAVPGAALAQNARLELRPGETLLEVEAEGVHRSRPDIMAITAGVVTTGRTVREATRANAALIDRLIETIRAQAVAPEDLRTVDLSIAPQFDERDRERASAEERRPRIVGYVATNRLEVTLRDLNRASALLDALVEAGANDVAGPHFGLSDPKPARRAARVQAVAEAREQADTYAGALGLRVVRVLRVSERGREMGEGNVIYVTGSRIPAQRIEPGEIETEIDVWVDFALAPQ